MDDIMPLDYVSEQIRIRDDAEANGLYDIKLNESQEMALASAMSTLSDLCQETNSSLSELLKMGGLEIDK